MRALIRKPPKLTPIRNSDRMLEKVNSVPEFKGAIRQEQCRLHT